jgi:hypothetical protein
MTEHIPDPAEEMHKRNRFEARRAQSVRQKRKIESVIDDVKLPKGMTWVDDGGWSHKSGFIVTSDPSTLQLDRDRSAWLAYLAARVPGTDRFHVKVMEFGWLTESASPSYIRERIEEAVNEFQKEIAEGRAKECVDGREIPNDCRFRDVENDCCTSDTVKALRGE